MNRYFYIIVLIAIQFSTIGCHNDDNKNKIFYQAHRGGMKEVPENTLIAFKYAWQYDGIPEADVRTTKDKKLICLHDTTLKRTTNAPKNINKININQLNYNEIVKYDAGVKFSTKYKGEKIPLLKNVFEFMKENNENIYLDIKQIDIKQLKNLVDIYKIEKNIIFASNNLKILKKFKDKFPNSKTMLWVGGTKKNIMSKFLSLNKYDYEILNQVQLHLHGDGQNKNKKGISINFIQKALKITKKHNIQLQILAYDFKKETIYNLLDIGIIWFCVNYPKQLNIYYKLYQKEHLWK